MTYSTNYSVVDVKDELPKKNGRYFVHDKNYGLPHDGSLHFDTYNDSWSNDISDTFHPQSWLKQITNSIILTKEELEARDRRVAAEAWDNGQAYAIYNEMTPVLRAMIKSPNKEQYINSLINK